MTALMAVWAHARKKMILYLTYRSSLAMWLVGPVLFTLPYILQAKFFSGPADEAGSLFVAHAGTPGYVSFVAAGGLLWSWATSIMWEVGFSVRDEQEEGTLESLWLTSAPRACLVLGVTLAHLAVSTVATTGGLLMIRSLFGLPLEGHAPVVVTILLLAAAGLYGMGFVFAGLVMLLKQASSVVRFSSAGFMIFCGAVYPSGVLPVWAQAVGRVIPLTWALDALRKALFDGAGWVSLRTEIAVLAVLAGISLPAGMALFARLESKARERGILGVY